MSRLPRAGVLGLGKAGGSLAASLLDAGAPLVAVGSRSARRRQAFRARHADGPRPVARLSTLLSHLEDAGAEMLFLAVPDDRLADFATQLAGVPWLPSVVAHLSGARGAEALAPVRPRAVPAAFHPLAALDGERPIPRGTLLAIDAPSAPVRRRLAALAAALGLEAARVKPGEHARYHAGAVVSANLAVALLDEGIRLLADAGVEPDVARRGLARLLESTARAAIARPLPEMLTGPVARGDAGTVARHLEVMADDPALRDLYRALSRRLCAIAALPAGKRRALERVLGDL